MVAVAATAALVVATASDPAKAVSMLVYGSSMVLMLGTSAVYHVLTWSAPVRAWLRRLDHSMIFVFIAGTYTAIVFNVTGGRLRTGLLVAIWALSLAGVALAFAARTPRWLTALIYVATGWIGIAAIPQLSAALGGTAMALILAGGASYSLGAVAYAAKRPRLWTAVFGYHEVFHALVLVATAAFLLVVAIYVVPYPRA